MGTPDFAVPTLKALLNEKYNVVGVITAPDRPAGRGQKLRESAVKLFAKSKGLPILQPKNLKNEKFLEALQSLKPNLQIVVAFRMLPKVVWQLPKYGTFNLHASLLPEYRGAAPINWAIINGETKTGVTTFFIDEKIDTGEIILQQEIRIESDENAGALHDKLMQIGSELVIETVGYINDDNVKTQPQTKLVQLKSANKLNKDNCKIDWSDTINNIYNKIRGLSPYPTAWCYFQNDIEKLPVKIYDVTYETIDHDNELGIIISTKENAKVAVKGGYIILKELQLPGKRKMTIKSLLNGFQFNLTAKML